ncbi:MAG TPA: hypothetical protein VMW58_01490 [Anaerolineae bacterium]|nr:hypothetical protein [Anaerolineae bacterium]
MAATTRTNYEKFMKELYRGSYVADLTYDTNAFLALVPKNTRTGGTKYIKPVKGSYATGRGANFATTDANIGPAQRLRWELDWTDHYVKCAVENKAMVLSRQGSDAAFRALLTDEVDGGHSAFANDVEIELHEDGTGTRGVAQGAIAGLVITVGAGQASNFNVGDKLVHLSAANALLDAGEEQVVTAVNRAGATDTITVDADWTTPTAAGQKLVLSGDQNAKAFGLKAWLPGSGVGAAPFNSIVRTVDPARYAGIDGVTGTLSGLEVTDCLVQTCANILRQGGRPNLAMLSAADFADLALETENRGRYAKMSATEGSVSFSALEIQTGAGAVPVVADRHTNDDNAFILDTRAVELYSAGPVPSMFNEDGSFYHRYEGADSLSFYLYAFYGLAIQDPGGCSWVQNVK